jgi:hypothetical protein
MRFFLAGIMQGSLIEAELHDQSYREHIAQLIEEHFPEADVYDPLAKHNNSLEYDDQKGRDVFLYHNRLCRNEVDVLIAFAPEASMGTAIEMWEAYKGGAAVISISPLAHNWAIRFLSHAVFPNTGSFESALESGKINQIVQKFLDTNREKN